MYYTYVLYDMSKKLPQKDKYGLVHPAFYVGKGQGGRKDYHVKSALTKSKTHNPKLTQRIQEIDRKGGKVGVKILKTFLNESNAFEHESQVIQHYGIEYKGGTLVNVSYGKAGGWGGPQNPTFARMKSGDHNFLVNNPQLEDSRLVKLTKLLREIEDQKRISGKNFVPVNWENLLSKTGYSNIASLRVGIRRTIARENLSLQLINKTLR